MELKLVEKYGGNIGRLTFNRTLWNWNIIKVKTLASANCAFNRTLWNWNHKSRAVCPTWWKLLIEPYGIETENTASSFPFRLPFNRTLWNWNLVASSSLAPATMPFNRTLWNWNNNIDDVRVSIVETFNRTLWNWNILRRCQRCRPTVLLIEPYGIETVNEQPWRGRWKLF